MSAAPVPQPPVGKVGLSKWLTGHKWEAVLGGGGIAVTIFLAYRARENSAASGGSSSTTGATQALPVSTYSGGIGGGGGSGDYGDLGPILSQLQSELSTAQSGGSVGGQTPVQPSGEVLSGGGYQPSSGSAGQVVESNAGQSYEWIPGSSIGTLGAAGTQIDEETAPGIFTPWDVNTYQPGTALYVATGQNG